MYSPQPLVDEQLDAPMVLGDREEKPAYTPEELEDFAQALNEFAINGMFIFQALYYLKSTFSRAGSFLTMWSVKSAF